MKFHPSGLVRSLNFNQPMALIVSMMMPVMLVFTLLRLGLMITSLDAVELSLLNFLQVLLEGLVYDLSFYSFASLPIVLYCWLMPSRIWLQKWHGYLVRGVAALSLYALCFIVVAELAFWQEFSVRFNFISVDYLVYRREVTNNILESYPVLAILFGLLPMAAILFLMVRNKLNLALNTQQNFSSRSVFALLWLLLPLACFFLVDQSMRDQQKNVFQRELASNGPFQFFAAFRNNELDYDGFYKTLNDDEASEYLRTAVLEENAVFLNDDVYSIGRMINNRKPEKRHNIILISVESLSARFLKTFGSDKNITPNLDALVENSLFFDNFYATGTRTTRGLEAITLSIPPTPGRSIVKRIGREKELWSLGNVFKSKDYEVRYLYGGRGYFDNMNAFFSGNGYEITDQSSMDEDSVSFENAWGVADEDLYRQVLKNAKTSVESENPFFYHVMTTSNHRPYTYPEGKIDIPSGSGRSGAVKYSDFAIGEFLAEAKKQLWFSNTIFVIVSDHTASSAGKTDLPVVRYHIPMWIYAPGIIEPKTINTLASQIDLAPTLLGLLDMSYESWFFGKDILKMDKSEGRIFIGTYQKLGYLQNENLLVLSPGSGVDQFVVDKEDGFNQSSSSSVIKQELTKKAIAFYQGANYIYQNGLNRWHPPLKAKDAVVENSH